MSKHVAVVLAFVLTGCAGPAVVGASRDNVILRYEPILVGRETAQAQATEECQTNHGDTSGAVFVSSSKLGPLGYRFDTFTCTAPPPALTSGTLPPAPAYMPPPVPFADPYPTP